MKGTEKLSALAVSNLLAILEGLDLDSVSIYQFCVWYAHSVQSFYNHIWSLYTEGLHY